MQGVFRRVVWTGGGLEEPRGERVDEVEFVVVGDVGSGVFKLVLRCDGRPDFEMELGGGDVGRLVEFFDYGCDYWRGARDFVGHFERNYGFKL